ncbi:MAG: hypothetical protein R3C05_06030 [Pirellulaceae bacterium]
MKSPLLFATLFALSTIATLSSPRIADAYDGAWCPSCCHHGDCGGYAHVSYAPVWGYSHEVSYGYGYQPAYHVPGYHGYGYSSGYYDHGYGYAVGYRGHGYAPAYHVYNYGPAYHGYSSGPVYVFGY